MKYISRFIYLYRQELFIIFLAVLTLLIAIPIFTYIYFAQDLKSKESLMNRNDTGVILLDRNNHPFYTFYQAKYKEFVPLTDIPKQTQEAVIASEDKDFFSHPGFSLRAIIRSMFVDIMKHNAAYGGSTITQQLVKNALLNTNKNFLRKYQEIVLAQEIERRFNKNEILEMYLNSVYFGEGAFGIENAAKTYFGKGAKDLTLAESALLTGILPAPSDLSPLSGNLREAKAREKIVLEKMTQQGYITAVQEKQAEKEQLAFHPKKDNVNTIATHFALMIKNQLVKQFSEEQISRSGFKVKTTIDLSLQTYAEQVVKQQVVKLAGDTVSNGAAVVMDPTNGQVLALVGSIDWNNEKFGKVNMATTPRSVGSSFKPIIYSSALENRLITPATVLQDVPTTFPDGYHPLDYDRKFRGPVLVRRALANSLNIPAVEVMQKVGLANGLEMAKRLGITTLGDDTSQYGLSLVLGAGEVPLIEMADVYGVFADQGTRNDITPILEIDDKSGKKIYSANSHPQSVLEPEVAFLISSILSDNNTRAEEFGNTLTIPRPAAVKTGTAEDFKDALTLGYTSQVVVGVWVGNNDNEAMDQIAGSLGAAPIWKLLMEKYLADKPIETFSPPSGIVQMSICRFNGLLLRTPQATSSAFSEYFIDGTQPTQYCTIQPPATPAQNPTGTVPTIVFPTTSQESPQQIQQQNENLRKQIQDQVKQQTKEMEKSLNNQNPVAP